MSSALIALIGLGAPELLIILVVGVLLFGKNLPDMGRHLGKGLVEFKKGMRGIEDHIDSATPAASHAAASEPLRPPQRVGALNPVAAETSPQV